MSQLVPIPWSTQSTHAPSGVVSAERLVNCHMDAAPAGGKGPTVIYGDPGLKAWLKVGTAPIRGWQLFGGDGTHLFMVVGAELYVVTSDKIARLVGTVPGSGEVHMCANATHVAIASDVGLYVATLTTIANVDGNRYTSAEYRDGYGIFTLADTEQIFISGVDDLTTVNPLDFTSADALPDNLVGCKRNHGELIAFGRDSIEHYYLSGDSYFPWSRTPGGLVEIGCAAGGSIAKQGRAVYWLGADGAVWVMTGYQAQRISTPGIERLIKSQSNPEGASSMTYSQDGHENYVLTFSGSTLVYDITTGLWHERESWDELRWRAQGYVRAWGLDLVFDFETNDIYELDPNTYLDGSDILVRTMQSPPLHGGGRRMLMAGLYVDCEMGTVAGAGVATWADPKFMLQWSDDGAKTWSAIRHGTAGKTGEYTARSTWTRLGSFYQRTIRLSLSDPIRMAVVGAYADLEVCSR